MFLLTMVCIVAHGPDFDKTSLLALLFLPKFMINVTIFILKLTISHFLDRDVPLSTSYGVYISKLISFDRASSHVADFNTRNKLLTQKRLKQS